MVRQALRFSRLASRFRVWLDSERSRPVIADLLNLTDAEFGEFTALYSDCVTVSAVRAVIDRSYGNLGRSQRDAAALARLATRLAPLTALPGQPTDSLLIGDAWRQLASALVNNGKYADAREACETAAISYAQMEGVEYERALLSLTRGQALCYLDRAEEGLSAIVGAAAILRPLSLRKFVTAQTMRANVLAAMERYEDAASIFCDAAVLAREDNDTEALAYIINGIGYCYMKLGDLAKARECLGKALLQFTRLGLKTKVLNTRTALVDVLLKEYRYNETISELFEIRRLYLELGMPILAAENGLWLVELLPLAGRGKVVPSLCEELIGVFTKARMPREARKAMAYLAAAVRRGVTDEDIKVVRNFMGRLHAVSDAVFEAPSRPA